MIILQEREAGEQKKCGTREPPTRQRRFNTTSQPLGIVMDISNEREILPQSSYRRSEDEQIRF